MAKKNDWTYYKVLEQKYKRLALAKLGGKCCWCGEDDPIVLVFDHINDDGHKFRHNKVRGSYQGRASGSGGRTLYKRIIDGNTLSPMQVLCFNCNHRKRVANSAHITDPRSMGTAT